MTYTVTRTSTADVGPRDRVEFWADHVQVNNGRLRSRFGGSGFAGRTVVQRGGEHQLLDFTSDGIAYARTRRDLDDGDVSSALVLPQRGVLRVTQDGEVAIGPGESVVITKARPFALAHADGARAFVLRLPPGIACGTRVSGALGAVVGATVRQIAAQRDRLDSGGYVAASQAAVDLVAAATAPPRVDPLALVATAARAHVRTHAHDPRLTPDALARALGWSLRQVQLALRAEGTTPARLIRDARLDAARRALLRSDRGIADIAYAAGFRSLSAFGAAFRERYGASPRDLR